MIISDDTMKNMGCVMTLSDRYTQLLLKAHTVLDEMVQTVFLQQGMRRPATNDTNGDTESVEALGNGHLKALVLLSILV